MATSGGGAVAALHPALKFYSSKLRQIDSSSSSLLLAVVQQQRCWMSCERLVHQCPPSAMRVAGGGQPWYYVRVGRSRCQPLVLALCTSQYVIESRKAGRNIHIQSYFLPTTIYTTYLVNYTLTNSQFEELCMCFFVSQVEVLGKIAYHIL